MTAPTTLTRLDFPFCERAATAGRTLYGVAAPFDTVTTGVAEVAAEQFVRGAFTGVQGMTAEGGRDAFGLWNHDTGQVLARVAAKTLRLRESSEGLIYELDLPSTTLGRDVEELAKRGEIGGVSIGFRPDRFETRSTAAGPTMTHTRVGWLRDVSLVAFPAYAGTTMAMRHDQTPALSLRDQLIRARARALNQGR